MAVFHPSRKVVLSNRRALLSAGLWVLPTAPVAEIGRLEMAPRGDAID
jgi:hypothetical protein